MLSKFKLFFSKNSKSLNISQGAATYTQISIPIDSADNVKVINAIKLDRTCMGGLPYRPTGLCIGHCTGKPDLNHTSGKYILP